MEDKERELLRKLKEAGKPDNNFTLTLKINDVIVEERVFSAEKYSLKTLSETRTHFLMNDLIKKILKEYSEEEELTQEELKKQQMAKLWERAEKNNNEKNINHDNKR